MKRIIAFILCTVLLFSAVYPAVSATCVESDTERFDDGSYITVTYTRPSEEITPPSDDDEDCYWENTDSAESAPSVLTKIIRWVKELFAKLFGKQTNITRYKYCNYFDSEGKLLWTVRLKGTFMYNHRKAVCVDSDITCEIRDSDWKLLSSDHSESGSSAVGSFAIRQYKLAVPLKLIEKTLTLSCDKEGNVK